MRTELNTGLYDFHVFVYTGLQWAFSQTAVYEPVTASKRIKLENRPYHRKAVLLD